MNLHPILGHLLGVSGLVSSAYHHRGQDPFQYSLGFDPGLPEQGEPFEVATLVVAEVAHHADPPLLVEGLGFSADHRGVWELPAWEYKAGAHQGTTAVFLQLARVAAVRLLQAVLSCQYEIPELVHRPRLQLPLAGSERHPELWLLLLG